MSLKKKHSNYYVCLSSKCFVKDDISLVSIRLEDINKIRVWRNKQIDILRQKKKITKIEQENYFKSKIFNDFSNKKPENILFSILRGKKLIGYGGLVHIDWINKRSEISFLLDDKISGKKEDFNLLFPIFLGLIKDISFDNLKLEKLTAELYDIRKYYIKPLRKNNFKIEGRLKKHVIINNNRIDSILFSCIKKNIDK